MSVSEVLLGSKTARVWRAAGLADLPEVAAEAPYREERARLRFQAAVFTGWTAWQLQEFPTAIAAFHAALDQPARDPELSRWLMTHLLERRNDYFQQPINGAWLPRSLRPERNQTGVLVEHPLPERTPASAYDEPTAAALDLLHRLLLAEPGELRHAVSLYYAYHPLVEPATQMVLAPIAAGTFLRASPESEPERKSDEGPRHQVTLSHDFWMGIYPVTQQQYESAVAVGSTTAGTAVRRSASRTTRATATAAWVSVSAWLSVWPRARAEP